MSYEVEAVPVQETPQNSLPMREERVVDPYRSSTPKPKKPSQSDINVKAEGSPEAPQDKPAETVTLSPAAAALARKEQKFRQEQAALKAQVEALEKDRAELTQLRELRAKLEAKDFSAIEDKVPYDEYTNYLIEKSAGAPSEELQAVKKLEAEVEGVKKTLQDEAKRRDEALGAERKKAVTDLVDSNPNFSAIKKMGAQDSVLQHILDTWEEDKIELSPEDAAKEVEELLREKAKRWASVIEPAQTAPPEPKNQLPPLKQSTKTLTNDMAPIGDTKVPKRSFAGMSDAERYAEARRRAEQKLKGK